MYIQTKIGGSMAFEFNRDKTKWKNQKCAFQLGVEMVEFLYSSF
jgi:hypothetical protein